MCWSVRNGPALYPLSWPFILLVVPLSLSKVSGMDIKLCGHSSYKHCQFIRIYSEGNREPWKVLGWVVIHFALDRGDTQDPVEDSLMTPGETRELLQPLPETYTRGPISSSFGHAECEEPARRSSTEGQPAAG